MSRFMRRGADGHDLRLVTGLGSAHAALERVVANLNELSGMPAPCRMRGVAQRTSTMRPEMIAGAGATCAVLLGVNENHLVYDPVIIAGIGVAIRTVIVELAPIE